MPRSRRVSVGGICYHVINRGNFKRIVFQDDNDYETFVDLIRPASERVPMRVVAFCLMPNHFHMVLWPREDGDLSRWMQWLMTSHVRRHHGRYKTSGRVWQGRFKGFPIQQDDHLLTVVRYVERNPLRAGLVGSAEGWLWSSLGAAGGIRPGIAVDGPVSRSSGWIDFVNHPQTEAELDAVRVCVRRQRPFGEANWVATTADRLDLGFTLRGRGRPRRAGSRGRGIRE